MTSTNRKYFNYGFMMLKEIKFNYLNITFEQLMLSIVGHIIVSPLCRTTNVECN